MSVLSILNRLKVDTKFVVPLLFVIGLLAKNVFCNSPATTHRDETDAKIEKLPFCDEDLINDRASVSKRNIYVTTLDGRLTTLDITKGSLQWSIPTEPGDLLSSSIHRLDLTNNGKYVRMIPSLNGGIYKFDGDSLEAIPITADDLLKSSFKFAEDLVISGGKEIRTYGVNSRTGNVIYECGGFDGCKKKNVTEMLQQTGENSNGSKFDGDLDDIVVINRHTQTVRASEPRAGVERWNFSIGHHELKLESNENCKSENDENDELHQTILDLELRVIVPDGIVCGYSKSNPNNILWKHKFEAPVVSVYRMDVESNKLYSVDLFKNVQWLWKGREEFKPSMDDSLTPSVYLGMYQQQLYIQEAGLTKASLDHEPKQLEQNIISDDKHFEKIPFKPYPASNNALVKLIEGKNKAEDEDENTELMNIDEKLNAQSVLYASQYADGKGFFFFTNRDFNQTCGKKTRSTHINPEDFDNVTFQNHGVLAKNSSLWDYWKEISVIALTTAFVINVMLNNRRKQEAAVVYVKVPYGKEAIEFQEEEQQMKQKIEDEIKAQAKIRSASESNTLANEEPQYVSRFLSDFDLVQCLGKGGFGVVFEVKNKLDDCHYAIKRILLPTKKESRERVMREVKTLANCEHKNIVRYFHAWVEQPPKGWQEQKDKELLTRDILSTSITIESPSPTEESKAFVIHDEIRNVNISASNEPWLLNLQQNNDFSRGDFGNSIATDDSCSFIQFKADTNDNCEEEIDDESFEIEFKHETQTSVSEMPSEASHVISFKASEGESVSETPAKKGHRRQMSLDLPSVSGAKLSKKSNGVAGGVTKMYLYIQMQLCMKNSLKDWLRATELNMRNGKTLEIWSQIIDAVHYVHLKGLIHRDLKPSNIFFALDGQIKIGDFGLVTDMAEIPIDPLTSSSSNSNSSANVGDFDFASIGHKKHTQRVGTSLYMSPEQAKGLAYNYKVDIYSLGLILFELLNFFNTETERFKVLENIRKHIFPPEFIINHKDEYELLKLMLSKQPEERPTTFGIFSRPPLNKTDDYRDWHFELPTRRRESHSSHNSLSK